MASELLVTVGARVRARRAELGLSRRQLSERSGISQRFISELEAGRGNISLTRFATLARALGTRAVTLLAGAEETQPQPLALLGLRGAGKSTVGSLVAEHLGVPFVEVDREIEATAGLSLGQIFELHGEDYYRRIETEVLARLLATDSPAVLAAGGSIVNHDTNFSFLKERARTVWLRASPEEHWKRVVDQGDHRPMAQNPHAYSELEALLSAREPLYRTADHTVETSGRSAHHVAQSLAARLL